MTINAVVGAGIREPGGCAGDRSRAQGSWDSRRRSGSSTIERGQLLPLDERQRAVVEEIVGLGQVDVRVASYNRFQKNLREESRTNGIAAPARDTSTSVKTAWCTGAHSSAATLAFRSSGMGRRISSASITPRKSCAPFCTIGCVHRVAQLDELRANPLQTLSEWFGPAAGRPASELPLSVRVTLVDVRDEPAP